MWELDEVCDFEEKVYGFGIECVIGFSYDCFDGLIFW